MKCQTVFPDSSSISSVNAGILTAVTSVVMVSNITANCTLLYSILKRRLLKSLSYKFIIALIICDLCVAFINEPLLIVCLYMKKDNGDSVSSYYCTIRLCAEFFAFLLCECSGVLVMNISLDRYLHMKHLQHYKTYMTLFRARALIITAWVFSAIIAAIFIISSLYGFLFIYHPIVLLVDLPVMCANFVLYARAFYAIRKKVMNLNLKSTTSEKERADFLFARAVTMILVCIIVCYSPYFALQTTWSYFKHYKNVTPNESLSVAVYWSILFIHISSLCNPIILISSDSEAKAQVRAVFTRFFSCFYSKSEGIDTVKHKAYGSTVTIENVTMY